ncbi:MAG: beta-galactosidase trimerization domain-containing protein [Armatimonadetes bacterium]|nr:beta-galactosidase trimerization domain-containing protein [Armatimonadota bacterium]
MRTTSLLATALLALAAAFAAPTLDEEQTLKPDFVTPHTNWATPYQQGKLRALCFTDYQYTRAREIVELQQRFDVQVDTVIWSRIVDTTVDQWHGGKAGEERLRRLLDNDYDVYLFNGIQLSSMPSEMQFKLLKKVTEGDGIVMVGVDDKRVLKKPVERKPGDPEAALFSILAGRGALLPAPPAIPYTFGWEVQYDYWQERLGRTVLWAAGKLPTAPLQVALATETVPRDEVPKLISAALPGTLARLDRRIRREGGAAWSLDAKGLPPAGKYHLDVWSKSQGRVISWATVPFAVTCERSVSVELAQDWGEVGDRLAGNVVLAGTPLPGERVRVELRDRRGRVLAATPNAAPAGETVPFGWTIPTDFPMLVEVRAIVFDAAGPACDAATFFNVTQRNRGRFNFLIWDIPSGATGPYAEEALWRTGMSLQPRGGTPPPYVAAYDVAFVPYTTRVMDPKNAEGILQPVTWNQEPEIDDYVQKIADSYQGARHHGVFVYSLGDETVTRGSDVSPSDLAAYRRHLESQYNTIDALNASWGADYGSFDQVTLLVNDSREAKAKADKNYPRWYDRQAWESANFLGLCKRFGDAYRKMDPQALTGFEGAGRLEDGDDLDGFVRTNGFWSPYPGPADNVLKGLAPRGFPRSNWMGYQKDADPLLWYYWRMVLNGCDAVWYWRWDGIGTFNGILMPDLTPFPQIKEVLEDTRITREGLGDLLLNSAMQDDGLAILYSQPSAYACQVADGPSYGSYASAHSAWQQALENLGLGYRYLTDAQLKRGEFSGARLNCIVLPRAEALSDAEVQALTDFVTNGGTVIADVRPGRYDGHCKPRESGALDELLGVDGRGSRAAAQGQVMKVGAKFGRELEAPTTTTDPGVQAAGAEPAGTIGDATPAVLVHKVGRGQAILLNFSMSTFPRPNARIAPPGTNELLAGLLASAGVKPQVSLARAGGEPLGDIQIARWRTGTAQIVGIMKQPDSEGNVMGMSARTGGKEGELTVDRPPHPPRPGADAQLQGPVPAQPRQLLRAAPRTRAGAADRADQRHRLPRRAAGHDLRGARGPRRPRAVRHRRPARWQRRRLAAARGGGAAREQRADPHRRRAQRPARELDHPGARPLLRADHREGDPPGGPVGAMMRNLLLLAAVLGALAAAAQDDFPVLVYPVPHAAAAPQLDGKLDDACWRDAPAPSGFTWYNRSELVAVQTTVRWVYTDDALYLGVWCDEPLIADLHPTAVPNDTHQVFSTEAVEIFFEPRHDHLHYFQFAVNAAGSLWDARGNDTSWESHATTAAALGDMGWGLELKVPFSSLEVAPQPGMVLGANVCRDRSLKQQNEWSSWSQVKANFHDPDRFAHLVLSPTTEQLADLGREFRKGDRTGPLQVFTRTGIGSDTYAAMLRKTLERVDAKLAELRGVRDKEPGIAAELDRRLAGYAQRVDPYRNQPDLDGGAFARADMALNKIIVELDTAVWEARLGALLAGI